MKETGLRTVRLEIVLLLFALCAGLSIQVHAGVKPTEKAAAISAFGLTSGVVRVKGSVPVTVDSKDKLYYLFEVNASTDKLAKMITSAEKSTSVVFDLKTADDPAYPIMKYALAVKTGTGSAVTAYTRISNCAYVSKPQNAAPYKAAYKYPSSKKGLQTGKVDLHIELGSKNLFINLPISTILNADDVSYRYNGTTYYFNDLNYVRKMASKCNQNGITMTVQLLLDKDCPNNLKAKTGSAPFYAFNVKNRESRQKMDAIFSYLGTTFGKDDCYVSNWILGNEVNSCSQYYFMGNSVSESQFVKNYCASFRSLYNAVCSTRANSRVYICLEHCWNVRNGYTVSFPGKSVLSAFDKQLDKMESGIKWNVAYHAYPADLKNAAFWKDGVSNSADAGIISPKNLSALTSYIKKEYGSDTRVIISETGFDSSNGENVQAAGLALAYFIAACDPMVDAFIIRSYEDSASDAAYGVHFGIKGKKALNVYKYMDTKNYMKYTESILKKTVGKNWKSYIKGFKDSRIYTMYHN